MKKSKRIFSIICISFMLLFGIQSWNNVQAEPNTGSLERDPMFHNKSETLADPLENPDLYDPSAGKQETKEFVALANSILGIIKAIGTILSVVMAVILGIKYMMGSIDEKAEYKKTMLPYIIGIVLLFAGSQIVGLIQQLVSGF